MLSAISQRKTNIVWFLKNEFIGIEDRWVDVRGEVNMVEGQVNRENTEAKKEMLIRSEGCRDRL